MWDRRRPTAWSWDASAPLCWPSAGRRAGIDHSLSGESSWASRTWWRDRRSGRRRLGVERKQTAHHNRLQQQVAQHHRIPVGHHSFFYGTPNALARVGLPADLLDYDIDNPEPVTLHDPRH